MMSIAMKVVTIGRAESVFHGHVALFDDSLMNEQRFEFFLSDYMLGIHNDEESKDRLIVRLAESQRHFVAIQGSVMRFHQWCKLGASQKCFMAMFAPLCVSTIPRAQTLWRTNDRRLRKLGFTEDSDSYNRLVPSKAIAKQVYRLNEEEDPAGWSLFNIS